MRNWGYSIKQCFEGKQQRLRERGKIGGAEGSGAEGSALDNGQEEELMQLPNDRLHLIAEKAGSR